MILDDKVASKEPGLVSVKCKDYRAIAKKEEKEKEKEQEKEGEETE